MTDLEDEANAIELAGGSPKWADALRRIELERADAERQAFERAAQAVEACATGGEAYRKALKMAAGLIRKMKG